MAATLHSKGRVVHFSGELAKSFIFSCDWFVNVFTLSPARLRRTCLAQLRQYSDAVAQCLDEILFDR